MALLEQIYDVYKHDAWCGKENDKAQSRFDYVYRSVDETPWIFKQQLKFMSSFLF